MYIKFKNVTLDGTKKILCLCCAVLMLAMSACGGGGAADAEGVDGGEDYGKLMLSLTDAEGDFLSYVVNVKSITLTRKNGQIVEVIPESTTIDFAQYVEMTEFFTAADIPTGRYTSVTMSLDYTDAEIVVEDADGEPQEATVVDGDGNSIAEVDVDVELSESGQLVIFPGLPSYLTIDFDLNSSHSLNMDVEPISATLEPVIIVDTILEEPKPHKLRGILGDVEPENSLFEVKVRPFRFKRGEFGTIPVKTNDDTVFEIDETLYVGKDGLLELNEMPKLTNILVVGKVDNTLRRFVATHVYAGGSLPWGDKDIVRGHVVAREGDQLTIRGATIVRKNSKVLFRKMITIDIADTTKVNKVGEGEVSKEEISIGSRISVFGDLTIEEEEIVIEDGDETAAPVVRPNIHQLDISLDATEGGLRIYSTTMCGTVVSVEPLVIDIQAIGGRPASIFDFTGTGYTLENDADAQNYEIDSAEMSLASVENGDPIRIKGFVNDFGLAPEDFLAGTIIDASAAKASLHVRWLEGGALDVFGYITAEKIILNTNTEQMTKMHHIVRSAILTDISQIGDEVAIVPTVDGKGLFTIKTRNGILVYVNFDQFTTELSSFITLEKAVQHLSATGVFDDATNILVVKGMTVVLK